MKHRFAMRIIVHTCDCSAMQLMDRRLPYGYGCDCEVRKP